MTRSWPPLRSIYETIPASFASAFREHPDDMATRLVYADWLDERGESSKAAYMRIRAQMLRLSPWMMSLDRRYSELRAQLEIHQQDVLRDGATSLEATQQWLRFINAIDLSTFELECLELEAVPATALPESTDERLRAATYPLTVDVHCGFVLERAYRLGQWPKDGDLHLDLPVTQEMLEHWRVDESFLLAKADDIYLPEYWAPVHGHQGLFQASGEEGYWVNYLIGANQYGTEPEFLEDPVLIVRGDGTAFAAENNMAGRALLLNYICQYQETIINRPMVRNRDQSPPIWNYLDEQDIPPHQREQLGPRPSASLAWSPSTPSRPRPRRWLTLPFAELDDEQFNMLDVSSRDLFCLELHSNRHNAADESRAHAYDIFEWARHGRLEQLHALDLSGAEFDNDQLATLPSLTELTSLNLANSSLDHVGCQHLLHCQKLSHLDLEGVNIDAKTVAMLGGLALEKLSLAKVNVDDEALNAFLEMTSLRCLSLDNTAITNKGVASLATSSLQLEELGISNTETDEYVAFSIIEMPSLQELRGGSSAMSLFLHQEMPHLRVVIDHS